LTSDSLDDIWLIKFDFPKPLFMEGGPLMARPAAKDLTERELELMHVFWGAGELTATDARDRLAAAGRDLSYPTVANLVRALLDKGFLRTLNEERPFRYAPCRTYEDVSGRFLTDLLSRVFRGSREQLFVRLLDDHRLTPKERATLKALLKEGKP
jgi:BlaI family penicillinase repressor